MATKAVGIKFMFMGRRKRKGKGEVSYSVLFKKKIKLSEKHS